MKERFKMRFNRIMKKICEIIETPKAFLKEGQLGGILAELLLDAFILTEVLCSSYFVHVPVVLYYVLCIILIFAITELLCLLFRISLGAKKKARVYFLVTFLCIFLPNLVANQAHSVFPAILMSFFLAVSIMLFGDCLYAFIKTKTIHSKFGITLLLVSTAYIILFVVFLNYDHFGDKRIEFYLNGTDTALAKSEDFDNYLKNGPLETSVITYGSKNADILTDTIDLTDIGEASPFIKLGSKYEVEKTPIAGIIYYPLQEQNCPVLFIVHGAHSSKTESYLGYEYLGEYLSSNGYVVVSIDENIVNELELNNDMRAVLLLENMKEILRLNKEEGNVLFGKIDEERIAIAGHSRGGEIVSTAYLFNDLEAYPNNGVVKFDYHFPITSIIAIAPTVDQYMPADHAVQIEDVNYLLIHGANDHDVSKMMGEKQYNNVLFTDSLKDYMKASVYILGANHGQFNSLWGRYDLPSGMKGYLNTNNFLDEKEQQLIAKAYFRAFLDSTLQKDDTYKDLLKDNESYLGNLPKTVYITNYMDSSYVRLCSFDKNVDLLKGDMENVTVTCDGMKEWTVHPDDLANDKKEENYVLYATFEENSKPSINISVPNLDLKNSGLSFRIGDRKEGNEKDYSSLSYTVTLTDINGKKVSTENPLYITPSPAIQLYKQDVLFGNYEYKHQMQTVTVTSDMFSKADFDFENVTEITYTFDGTKCGQIMLDDICIY